MENLTDSDSMSKGGALRLRGTADVSNCIFRGNDDGSQGGPTAQTWNGGAGTVTVSFSNIDGGWTGPGSANIDSSPESRDPAVDLQDLLIPLATWGPCASTPCDGDFDERGEIDFPDILSVLFGWGVCAFHSPAPPPAPLSLELERADSCLTIDDWEDFETVMTDPHTPQSTKDNWQCWTNHHLNECAPTCGQAPCTAADPYGNPCNPH